MAGLPALLFVISVCTTPTRAEKHDNASLSIENVPKIMVHQFNNSSYKVNHKNHTVNGTNSSEIGTHNQATGHVVKSEHILHPQEEIRVQNLNQIESPINNNNTNNNNNTETNSTKVKTDGSGNETNESENNEDELYEDDGNQENDTEEVTMCYKYDFRYVLKNVENLTELIKTNKISDLISIPRANLTHCSFKESSKVILCEFIGIAYDYKPFISYDFSLRIVFTFQIIKNDSETEVSGCENAGCLVKATRVQMEKIEGRGTRKNVTKEYLGPTFMIYFLQGLEKMKWEIYFSAEVPVGILYMNSDCTGLMRMKSSCINRVEVINFAKILSYKESAYCPEFWEGFRIITSRVLGGRNSSLNLKSYSQMSHFFYIAYLKDIMNGTGLTSLTLNNFNFKIVKTIMQNMPLLKFLDLSNNNIDQRKADALKEAPNVEHLDISTNELEIIPRQISLLRHLKYLDISRNPVTYLQSDRTLSNLRDLHWLLLSNTRLNNLEVLSDLLKSDNSSILLQDLDVSNCNISSIQDTKFFKQQTQLESVNLSGNNVSVIPPKLFIGLKNLKFIGISNLRLTHAPKLELGFATTLELIDLSHNSLTSPEDILVSGKVKHLDLSFNLIKEWSDEAIFSLDTCWDDIYPKCNATAPPDVWVENLNLSYNLLPTVTNSMAKTLTNLRVVDIGENPFNCSHCNILEFRNWVRQMEGNSSKVNIVSLGMRNDLKCKLAGSVNRTLIRNIWSLPDVCVMDDNWLTIAGSVVGMFLLLCLLIAVMVVRYKFEMAYVMFMLKQKRKRNSFEQIDGFEYDAFICYSRHDRSWVMQEMVPTLEECAERFRLCLHERDFILGSFISLNITQSIHRSRFTVLVLSKSFIESQWCRWELEVANYKLFETGREFLILIELERLSDEIVPRHLKFLMDTRTYLEWPEKGEDTATAWKRLRKSLGKSLYQQKQDAAIEYSSETKL